ncbi:protein FAR1-RELATED SEQUENCE 5-like [Juglans microcarpa x Juglans regia]|uniref:protein FAR1-RELATED SEQUENCE 5-like n=1 Tax=Juglans microcarpa x Juglans regia TaxID=2249226 RepID=UPI001B7E69FF|nr:protein FAR1-RELATED SEQUENCE 5-like [Juglans microcarpa x Juglans regia]
MNAFFDEYINSRTNLKQFVDQYDSAIRMKVENEIFANFNSWNMEIPYINRYPLEKQFQKINTIAKFKEVQEELRGFLYLTTSLLGCEGGRYTFVVADEVQVSDDLLKRATFTVKVDQDPLDVKCSSKLFEFRGILCRHRRCPKRYHFTRSRRLGWMSVRDGFESLMGMSVLVGEEVYCDLGLASLAEEEMILKAELLQAIGEREYSNQLLLSIK